MKGFLAHKKGKAFAIGIALNVIVMVAILAGWLPADDPNTEENETMMAILALFGGANAIPLGFLGAQGYADGKSKGATSTKLIPIFLLLGICLGCAAPAGVIKAHEDMGQAFRSLVNQHGKLIDSLAIPDAEKLDLLMESKVDISAVEQLHARMGEYLEATDVFDQNDATDWIEVGKRIMAAARGGG